MLAVDVVPVVGGPLLEDFRQAVIGMISKMADMGYIKSKIDSQFSKFANKYRCKYCQRIYLGVSRRRKRDKQRRVDRG